MLKVNPLLTSSGIFSSEVLQPPVHSDQLFLMVLIWILKTVALLVSYHS